jgi:hypothetical protein
MMWTFLILKGYSATWIYCFMQWIIWYIYLTWPPCNTEVVLKWLSVLVFMTHLWLYLQISGCSLSVFLIMLFFNPFLHVSSFQELTLSCLLAFLSLFQLVISLLHTASVIFYMLMMTN